MSMYLQGANIHGGEFNAIINPTIQNGGSTYSFHSEPTKVEIRG
jgi:hypothetical protein